MARRLRLFRPRRLRAVPGFSFFANRKAPFRSVTAAGREPKNDQIQTRECSMTAITEGAGSNLHRTIDWKGAFWVASGVPALVLFSIGGIAGTVGIPAYAVWIVSMLMGFIQSFTYAEIAGLFPNKSGRATGDRAAGGQKKGKIK